MSYSINTNGLPTLHNYAQALKHYESIKPIKSKKHYNDGVLPLGDRRHLNKTIHQLFNGDIACQLYSTDCVVYHQDDSITVNFGGWNTISTGAFVNAILPQGFYSQAVSGYILTNKGTFKVPSGGLKILPDGTPVNPVQEYRTQLDKKKAAETRKKLKPFLGWVKTVEKFGGVFKSEVTFEVGVLLDEPNTEMYAPVATEYFGKWLEGFVHRCLPYRIVWCAINEEKQEMITGANTTKRQANDCVRKGYEVYIL